MAKNEKAKKDNVKQEKFDGKKLFVRIMAIILAGLMVLSVAASLIYYLV